MTRTDTKYDFVTVIIPTRNEAGNIGELYRGSAENVGLAESVPGAHVILVDDSDDLDTVNASFAAGEGLPLDILVDYRTGSRRTGGLFGAVVMGIEQAKPDSVIVVMDGDMQHPPDLIPAMIEALNGAEITVASRYCPGGSAAGLGSPLRHIVSKASTYVARGMFPYVLRGVTDPMTGFFAFRKASVDLGVLDPRGFKALLGILVTHPRLRRRQVPLRMPPRKTGESKGTMKQGIIYLQQLLKLRLRFLTKHNTETLEV